MQAEKRRLGSELWKSGLRSASINSNKTTESFALENEVNGVELLSVNYI